MTGNLQELYITILKEKQNIIMIENCLDTLGCYYIYFSSVSAEWAMDRLAVGWDIMDTASYITLNIK